MISLSRYCLQVILLIMMLGPGFTTLAQPRDRTTLTSDCENYLYINGESNVNQFSFRYNKTDFSDRQNRVISDSGSFEITIPIRDFEASNPLMYGDFLVLMKETEYPLIRVTFSKQELMAARGGSTANCPDIRITIAGITNAYKIQCSVVKCSDYLYLSGEKTIKLSDFHLKPPEKVFGFVKVNNEINVNFGFIITFTDSNPISAKL